MFSKYVLKTFYSLSQKQTFESVYILRKGRITQFYLLIKSEGNESNLCFFRYFFSQYIPLV